MKKYILDNLRKFILLSSLIIFILGFVLFLLYGFHQEKAKITGKLKVSAKIITNMFSHNDIDRIINQQEEGYLIKELNNSFKFFENHFRIKRDDILLVEKRGKQYFLVFMRGLIPIKNSKKEIKISDSSKLFPFKEGKKYFLLLNFARKIRVPILTSFVLSLMFTLLSMLSFYFIFKRGEEKFKIFEQVENSVSFKSINIKSIKVSESFRRFSAFISKIGEIVDLLETFFEFMNKEDCEADINEAFELSGKIFDSDKEVISETEKILNNSKEIMSKIERSIEIIKTHMNQSFKDKFEKSGKFLEELEGDMKKIEEMALEIDNLMEKSKSAIENILEIAEQTHLISINAAIEASGEEGNKRFSVVAKEMRKLSGDIKSASVVLINSFDLVKKSLEKEKLIINSAFIKNKKNFKELLDFAEEERSKTESDLKQAYLNIRESKSLIENLFMDLRGGKEMMSDMEFSAKVLVDRLDKLKEFNKKLFSMLSKIEIKLVEVRNNA